MTKIYSPAAELDARLNVANKREADLEQQRDVWRAVAVAAIALLALVGILHYLP